MKTITFIILGILCLAMAVLYVIFRKDLGWKGVLARGLTMLSLITFALVSANLNDINNSFSIFICLAFGFLIVSEIVDSSGTIDEKYRFVLFSAFSSATYILFACATVALSEFNFLALVGGLLVGLGVGAIVCAGKKSQRIEAILMTILQYSTIGLIIGCGIMGITASTHLMSSCLILGSGALLLFQTMIRHFKKEDKHGKLLDYVSNAMFIIALMMICASVCLY